MRGFSTKSADDIAEGDEAELAKGQPHERNPVPYGRERGSDAMEVQKRYGAKRPPMEAEHEFFLARCQPTCNAFHVREQREVVRCERLDADQLYEARDDQHVGSAARRAVAECHYPIIRVEKPVRFYVEVAPP